jgi:hypothetical protein
MLSTGTCLGQCTGDLQSSSLLGRDSSVSSPSAGLKGLGSDQRAQVLGGRMGQEEKAGI